MLFISPAMCVSIGGTASPTLLTATVATYRAIECGISWQLLVSWTIDFTDDTNYEIRIRDAITTDIVADGLLTSAGSQIIDTEETGDSTFTGVFHSAQYQVQLIRKADSQLMQTLTTDLIGVETGAPC